MTDTRPWTEVAVGILIRPDGALLFAQRPPGKPYAGWWEFPGGKVEAGESVADALARELHEELGIAVTEQSPWVLRHHVYPHARVRLHFRRITGWEGEPRGLEGQRFTWCHPDTVDVSPMLPAAVPVIGWLRLPPLLALSMANELGDAVFLQRLAAALEGGLKLLVLREPGMEEARFAPLFRQARDLCELHGARLLVSSRHGASWARAADGTHLTARDLCALDARPPGRIVGASCHDAAGLAKAAALGLDYALLGPVAPTGSHPGAPVLGWEGFERLAADAELPVYALGGLRAAQVTQAMAHGAHGVALRAGAWETAD